MKINFIATALLFIIVKCGSAAKETSKTDFDSSIDTSDENENGKSSIVELSLSDEVPVLKSKLRSAPRFRKFYSKKDKRTCKRACHRAFDRVCNKRKCTETALSMLHRECDKNCDRHFGSSESDSSYR